jgi:ribosomal protein L37AE/L43A
MKKNIVSAVILLSCYSIIGMQEDKKLLSFVALKNKEDRKKVQDLGKELHKCERCHKYNAVHRHPDVIGFMCADCSNKVALWHLEMVLGPCDSTRAKYMDEKNSI